MAKFNAARAASTLGGMKGAVFTLTGDESLIKTLAHLRDSVARRAMRKGLTKAMRIVAKGMKAQVPVNLKSMKPAIGSRLSSGKSRGQFTAKAGAAVGKASKVEAKTKKAKRRGVGIGGRNIHWWILGTASRTNAKTGKSTGAMPAIASQVVKAGFAASQSQASEVIKHEIAVELAKPHKVR
jgi:hypothetical protein